MSVPSWERGQSEVEFLDTARKLEKYTIQTCVKFPKRYMFVITGRLISLSQDVYDNAKKANSIYAETRAEEEMRITYLAEAICSVQALSSQIDVARITVNCFEVSRNPATQKTKSIKPQVWKFWGDMINKEYNLLKAVHKTFCKKYNDKYAV